MRIIGNRSLGWGVVGSAALGLVACGGSSEAPRPPEAAHGTESAGSAESTALQDAPKAQVSGEPSATPPTASASASAVASPEPAPPPPPPHRGKCPTGMSEVAGGKFKSSYYRLDMSVAPFCIDTNLVTTDEYTACIEAGKCDKSAVHACDPSTYGVEGRGQMPMICVDFMQAERYCKVQGKRLVSDLEWEWVARGGDEARTYPWGNDAPADQLCWSGKEKRTTPCPVASYPPGPQGVYDLTGNILQWTTTTNDSVSSFRGGRGGSWKDGVAEQVKITRRGGFKNTYRCGFLGIRCASEVP
jgi:formylglycine-generating enzyme required for sulfatase activity